MENERQTTGEIKLLQKALKNPSTTHNENCISLPVLSKNTAERKQKLFCVYVIHPKMLLTLVC